MSDDLLMIVSRLLRRAEEVFARTDTAWKVAGCPDRNGKRTRGSGPGTGGSP